MSPLTKVFVILLVVCSMLTSAATVVFVNKSNITEKASEALKEKNNALQNDKEAATNKAAAEYALRIAAESQASIQAADSQLAIAKLGEELKHTGDQLAQQTRIAEAQNTNIMGLNHQMQTILDTDQTSATVINSLNEANSAQAQRLAETEAALARQRQLAETYGRQVEFQAERLKKLEEENKAMASALQKNQIPVPNGDNAAAPPSPAPQVTGKVQDKQNINGVTYLTISVGSSDSVQTGTEFSVVDTQAQPPQFLGILTITTTDTNTSTGRLQGDPGMVAKVKQGDEVTTRLQ